MSTDSFPTTSLRTNHSLCQSKKKETVQHHELWPSPLATPCHHHELLRASPTLPSPRTPQTFASHATVAVLLTVDAIAASVLSPSSPYRLIAGNPLTPYRLHALHAHALHADGCQSRGLEAALHAGDLEAADDARTGRTTDAQGATAQPSSDFFRFGVLNLNTELLSSTLLQH